jgi:hypothetical protein
VSGSASNQGFLSSPQALPQADLFSGFLARERDFERFLSNFEEFFRDFSRFFAVISARRAPRSAVFSRLARLAQRREDA